MDLDKWIKDNRITEVECLVPDFSGVARGKILPAEKFLRSQKDNTLRLPVNIFAQTVTGDFVESEVADPLEPDVVLHADPSTLCLVPWYADDPTAQVINDCLYPDGAPVEIAPRQVLKRILALYAKKGWKPIVAPELEFFLVAKNLDPDYPLQPPIGKSGRPETGRQSYGIDAVNEFDPIFEDVYDFCEKMDLDVDTLIHEAGMAQVEINFNHGEALGMADQAFLFKRVVRHAALKHDVYATFMAKPYAGEAGSAMHIHQSVVDAETGLNLFANDDGEDSELFRHFLGGMQRYLPAAMPMLAPNVNSYRRLVRSDSAPINLQWGRENRTAGLRVPDSGRHDRRVENRLPGADVNPYLGIAASLACGYLGMVEELKPRREIRVSAYTKSFELPRSLPDALDRLADSEPLQEILGPDFVRLLIDVKREEYLAHHKVISAWEREHLLLNV